jgi:hypothetical protein
MIKQRRQAIDVVLVISTGRWGYRESLGQRPSRTAPSPNRAHSRRNSLNSHVQIQKHNTNAGCFDVGRLPALSFDQRSQLAPFQPLITLVHLVANKQKITVKIDNFERSNAVRSTLYLHKPVQAC